MSTYVIWLHASLVHKFQISWQHAWTQPPIPFPLPIVFGKILIRIFSPPGSVRLSSFAQQSWSSYRCGHWSVPRCHALRHVQRHHDLTPSTAPPAASQGVQLPASKVEKVASLHLANNHQLSKWYWSGSWKRMKPSRQHSIKIKEKMFLAQWKPHVWTKPFPTRTGWQTHTPKGLLRFFQVCLSHFMPQSLANLHRCSLSFHSLLRRHVPWWKQKWMYRTVWQESTTSRPWHEKGFHSVPASISQC